MMINDSEEWNVVGGGVGKEVQEGGDIRIADSLQCIAEVNTTL